MNQRQSVENITSSGPSMRSLIVIVPGYTILTMSLAAVWQMQSINGVIAVAVTAAALTGILFADFKKFRASTFGVTFEARRHKKAAKRKRGRGRRDGEGHPKVAALGSES